MTGRILNGRVFSRPTQPGSGAPETGTYYVGFDRHDAYGTLSAGKKNGVFVREVCGEADEVRFVYVRGAPHTARDGSGFYNGGCYHWGSLTSLVRETATRFDTLVPSWTLAGDPSRYVDPELEVRARSGGLDPVVRHGDLDLGDGERETPQRERVGERRLGGLDRHLSESRRGRAFANAYQYRLTLFTEKWGVSPRVRGVFVTLSDSRCHGECLGVVADEDLWGRELVVPARSQMAYPDGGEAWCSPASLSMVMAYWAGKLGDASLEQPVPTVA